MRWPRGRFWRLAAVVHGAEAVGKQTRVLNREGSKSVFSDGVWRSVPGRLLVLTF